MSLLHIVLVFLALVNLSTSQGYQQEMEEFSREISPYAERLIQKNTIKYLESCSYPVEQQRHVQEKSLLKLMSGIRIDMSPSDLTKFKKDLLGVFSSLANIDGSFCNAYSNLQCNSEGKCVCAEAHESLGFKVKFTREGERCVIHAGSLCAPQEIIDQLQSANPFAGNIPKQDIRCTKDAACIIKSDGRTCTGQHMNEEVQRMVKDAGRITDPIKFAFQKVKEGICVCKGVATVASTLLIVFSAIVASAISFN